MFNDRFGLTDAVLAGQKTMTRRIAKELEHPKGFVESAYKVGDVVAVAQSYERIYLGFSKPRMRHDFGMRVAAVHHSGDLHNIDRKSVV